MTVPPTDPTLIDEVVVSRVPGADPRSSLRAIRAIGWGVKRWPVFRGWAAHRIDDAGRDLSSLRADLQAIINDPDHPNIGADFIDDALELVVRLESRTLLVVTPVAVRLAQVSTALTQLEEILDVEPNASVFFLAARDDGQDVPGLDKLPD